MSNDTHKADQIAFHFYTKLFYAVNDARATEEPKSQGKVDKWFNLETPDSDLFTKEAREPYRSISLASPPGPQPFEIQVLLSVPELTNNQVLVYMSPDSSRVRIEPTKSFILLEQWTLEMTPDRGASQHGDASGDVALPIIYKHGIVLFRSLFSLLRVLPAWKFYKRLKRRVGGMNRNGNLGIQLRVRSPGDNYTEWGILGFDDIPSPKHRPLPISTHVFAPVPHLIGNFTLTATYLTTPNFQLDELESLLSSRFLSLDQEGFMPTLDKNRQRDSITGSNASSLPTSSGIRSVLSRSPPKAIGRGSSGSGGTDSVAVAERFIIPSRVTSIGAPSLGITSNTGSSALIPPPRPFPSMTPSNTTIPTQPIPASGLAFNRIRKESLNSSSSSSFSTGREQYPINNTNLTNPFGQPNPSSTSSLSSSPVSGAMPIRRPNINPVHPFKSNTLSSASGSSPSLSIRQAAGSLVGASGSPVGFPTSISGGGINYGAGVTTGGQHSRAASVTASPIGGPNARLPPSPIGSGGFGAAHPSPPGYPTTFAPSSLGDRRPGTSGSGTSQDRDRDRRGSMNSGRVSSPVSAGLGSGGDNEERHDAMPVPQRKRYSSSFGHRYVGSVGSTTSIPAGSSGSGLSAGAGGAGITGGGGNEPQAGSTPGSGNASGRGTPASLDAGDRGLGPTHYVRKEGTSFLSNNTDDDDISIFVQDIDSRKPLSGREKEQEKRDREREQGDSSQDIWTQPRARGTMYERAATDTTTHKGKERAAEDQYFQQGMLSNAPHTTSPPAFPLSPASAGRPSSSGGPASPISAAAYMSTSPTRGPMLTSQDEVDERLKTMNETFLKSLESISGGSVRRKSDKPKPTREGSTVDSDETRSTRSGSTNSSAATARPSRGIGLGLTGLADSDLEPTSSPLSARAPYPYPYNTPGVGLGLGRGHRASRSSSTLSSSGVGASQGSEEVIGKMDLYEERRRRGGYPG